MLDLKRHIDNAELDGNGDLHMIIAGVELPPIPVAYAEKIRLAVAQQRLEARARQTVIHHGGSGK